ncbi:MAG TPA: trehalose-phosphatase [Candidatus Saccharimonadales bacterium]|nr:trehalose-phosphatase [Candidatus Saccharimonadales bacterium]
MRTIYIKLAKLVSNWRTIKHMDVDIVESYANSNKRLFLLDYDGTLVSIARLPEEAKPSAKVLNLLALLASDTKNTVAVVSGRKYQDLEMWLGHLPIAFFAEHGMLVRLPGQDWTTTKNLDTSWKIPLRQLMQQYVSGMPGSFIEEKTNGLVWHYRTVTNQEGAEQAATALAKKLEVLSKGYHLRIICGSKIVEVQPESINKSTCVVYWLGQRGWDFVLIAGDDTTDEDMFRAAPESAFTIKVGEGSSAAHLKVASPEELLELLASLT